MTRSFCPAPRGWRAACVALLAATAGWASAQQVGVSVQVGQPGFYGRIDLSNAPSPAVYEPQPLLIRRVAVPLAPVYLRVPPGHRKNWSKHCQRYDACSRPVYFVREDWYERHYGGRASSAPPPMGVQERPPARGDQGPGEARGQGRGQGPGNSGRGEGPGRGKGRGGDH